MQDTANTAVPQSLVNVVIPLYRSEISPYERIALQQCGKVLGHYPITLIAPDGLDLDGIQTILPEAQAVRLPQKHFAGIQAYNRLVLSEEFYERFADHAYMLIYQLDAFVFHDELTQWCERGYDYVGAPWPRGDKVYPLTFRGVERLQGLIPFWNKPVYHYVGNGGFSLRKIASCLDMLRRSEGRARHWPYHEDIFWPHMASLFPSDYVIPAPEIARHFAIEREPSTVYAAMGQQLPFGCHAWYKYETEFWFPIIRSFGYDL